jgi:hypothetical protein
MMGEECKEKRGQSSERVRARDESVAGKAVFTKGHKAKNHAKPLQYLF